MPHSPPSRPGTAPCAGGGLPEGLCRGLGAGPPGVQPDQGAGQGTGSRERDAGRPRTRGKGPSDTALVPPPDHPSTSRHPRPRPRGLQGPPIRARGSVWPANPGPPFSAASNHSPPFQSGSGPVSSARSAAARPLRAAPSPRSPQALLGPRKGGGSSAVTSRSGALPGEGEEGGERAGGAPGAGPAGPAAFSGTGGRGLAGLARGGGAMRAAVYK
ncbi:translation initiation factor IF-2-like [Manacus candei]|uniref:translation initiation factor IF-2-like n=1 Tax=Manacus candei TaxID=415023 RepID=UPI00222792AA|nr:translation initiation factor IF-2-like [Manacus candei]